jgi:hypothetical protein
MTTKKPRSACLSPDGYLHNIKKVWDVKEAIYKKTKNMTFNEYVSYMNKDIAGITSRMGNKVIEKQLV